MSAEARATAVKYGSLAFVVLCAVSLLSRLWADEPKGKPAEKDGWTLLEPGQAAKVGQVTVTIHKVWYPITGNPEGEIEFEIEVKNTSDTKIVTFSPWSAGGAGTAALKDEYGNVYKRFVKRLRDTDIRPGKSLGENLTFTKPVEKAEWLFLELNAENVGGENDQWLNLKLNVAKWTKPDPKAKGKVKKK